MGVLVTLAWCQLLESLGSQLLLTGVGMLCVPKTNSQEEPV